MKYFSKILPISISESVHFRPSVLNVLKNISWLLFDKVSRLGAGLLVGVFIARYLGPENYGLLNYAIAFSGLVGAFASLGLDSIVVKELVKNSIKKDEILGSAFLMKLGAGLLVLIINLIIISIVKSGDRFVLALVALSSLGFVFQAVNVIDFYYQSQVKIKYSILAQNAAFLILVGVRIILLLTKAPVIAFAFSTAAESVLISVFLILAYRNFSNLSIFKWKFDNKVAVKLFKESWPLIFASVASMINMRLDQVLIGNMLDEKSVGIYSVAVRISELWFMIPMFLGMSIYPSIIAAKEKSYDFYRKRLHKIVFYMSCFVLPLALIITFGSNLIIQLLYGPQFLGAGKILAIHIWSGVPYVAAFAYGQVFYIENLTRLSLYSAIYTVIINVILNLLLIPQYGAVGSAVSSLISAISAFIFSMILLNKNSKIFNF